MGIAIAVGVGIVIGGQKPTTGVPAGALMHAGVPVTHAGSYLTQ